MIQANQLLLLLGPIPRVGSILDLPPQALISLLVAEEESGLLLVGVVQFHHSQFLKPLETAAKLEKQPYSSEARYNSITWGVFIAGLGEFGKRSLCSSNGLSASCWDRAKRSQVYEGEASSG